MPKTRYSTCLCTTYSLLKLNMTPMVLWCVIFPFSPFSYNRYCSLICLRNQKSTWTQTWHYAKKFVLFLFLLGGYSSLLLAYDYEPFVVAREASLLDVGRLANNALVARECPFLQDCLRLFLRFVTVISMRVQSFSRCT